MKKKNLIVMLIAGVILFISGALTSVTAHAEGAALSVKAILPENQFNKDVSYYYLKVEPGDKQDLEVEIFNSSDEEVTALVTLTAATTNDNGMIDYNLPDKKLDNSLLLPFTKIASTPNEVKVPAGKSVITKVTLDLPSNEFQGMILGGINIRAKKAEKKEDEAGGGMKIINEMNYALGVVLIENDSLVKTNMTYIKTQANQVMGNNTTKVRLQNDTTAVIEDLTIEAQIFRKGNDEILYETKQEGYRMAPNSNFDFGVPIGKDRYRAGNYRVKIVATSDPKNPEKNGEKQVWTFDEEFRISNDQARKLNSKAVDIEPDYILYFILGAGAVILLITGTIIAVILIKKRKKKEDEAKPNKRKRHKKNSK